MLYLIGASMSFSSRARPVVVVVWLGDVWGGLPYTGFAKLQWSSVNAGNTKAALPQTLQLLGPALAGLISALQLSA